MTGTIALHVQQGNELGRHGDLDKAFEQFQQALTEDPDCAEAYFGMAAIWYKKNELFRAEQCLVRVLQLEPGHERAQHLLSTCEQQQKMRSSAFPGMDANETLVPQKKQERKSLIIMFGIVIPLLLALGLLYYWFLNR